MAPSRTNTQYSSREVSRELTRPLQDFADVKQVGLDQQHDHDDVIGGTGADHLEDRRLVLPNPHIRKNSIARYSGDAVAVETSRTGKLDPGSSYLRVLSGFFY